jgi:spermidine synthase
MRIVALLLTVLTGATGLVYEVTWQKYLSTLLGSHSEATAAVLGLFLAGLSAGYALFGRLTRRQVAQAAAAGRPPPLLLTYGLVEGGIGVYALLFPLLFALVQGLSFRVPHGAAGTGFAFDVGLAALLILPPTILMGGTIPILTQALSRSLADATRFHALVYAFNTGGAVVGALSASFVLVPWLGLRGVMWAMGAVNVGVGLVFLLLARRAAPARVPPPAASASRPAGLLDCALAALLVGFAMMVVQTVLIRLAGLSFGSSQFTFAMVVAVFVLCIAIGSFAVSALPRIPSWLLLADLGLLIALLYAVHPILGVGPFWAHVLRTLFSSSPLAFHPYFLAGFLGLLLLIGPAVVLSGATLPLLFHQLRDREGDLGAVAGALYGWNTVGSLLGALLGGYVLLFWLDLDHVYRIALAALALATALLFSRRYGVSRLGAAAVLLGILGALWVLRPWDPRQLAMGLYRSREPRAVAPYTPKTLSEQKYRRIRMLFYDDDPIASVSVFEVDRGGRTARSIINNGKSDGATDADYPTMGLLAALPALVADRVERAFVIGYGTGVTVGELAALDSTHEVVVAEISPGVVAAAPLFDPMNLGASVHPEVRIVRSDAYRALLRSEAHYDAIVSEPSNPWVTGVEMLYSREFLAAARSRLRDGGVFVQWFHQYETDAASVELVLRTYLSVFDEVAVWYGAGPDLLLLGFSGPAAGLDLARLEARAAQRDVAALLGRSGIGGVPELLAHELLPAGVLAASGLQGPIHTLFHPRLSHSAGRAFFTGGRGELPFTGFGAAARAGARSSLLRRYLARFGAAGPPEAVYAALAEESCSHRGDRCATVLADWGLHHPGSPALAAAAARLESGAARFGSPLQADRLPELRTLLAGGRTGSGDVTPALAQASTALFRAYYDHAFPFDAAGLLARWRACHGPGDACESGRERTRRLLTEGLRGLQDGAGSPAPPRARLPEP